MLNQKLLLTHTDRSQKLLKNEKNVGIINLSNNRPEIMS